MENNWFGTPIEEKYFTHPWDQPNTHSFWMRAYIAYPLAAFFATVALCLIGLAVLWDKIDKR